MSRESLMAAKIAKDHGCFRSACSRAYFSAYAALAGVFAEDGTIDFSYEGTNPGHQQLLALTANDLDKKRYTPFERREIKADFGHYKR